MNNRAVFRNTNRLAITWLLDNDFDYVHLKPHRDARKNRKIREGFWRRSGFTSAPLDYYRLFDGFCFDKNGVFTWLQISTRDYHKTQPYVEFLKGKFGFRVLFIKAVKIKNKWHIKTREISQHTTNYNFK